MKTPLYNTAHPLAESGKPIFIPFGEWKYDGQSRQRLDRAHGEKIANELNARVAKGDPGIPVYQGHPDVPALAAKYPDKGALGWVVRAELVNEGGKDGLALTVEWDRDPGRGFRWFSPYWLANSREGSTYIVDEIASIGLVNNPNIPEFRLANEQHMKTKLNPAIIELAAKYDRLANEANFDESKHPRSEDGKFSSGGGGGGKSAGETQSGGGTSYREKQIASRQADVDSAQKAFDAAKAALIAGQKRGWSKEEDDKAFKVYDRAERKLAFAKRELRSAIGAPPISRAEQMRRDTKDVFRGNASQATRARLIAELAARLDRRLANEKALANVIDANGMGHDDDNGQFDGSGTGGSSGGSGGESQSSRLDRMLGEARAGVAKAKAKATAAKKSRISASRKFHKELEAHLKKMRERRLALKEFNDKMAARLSNEENFDESKHPRSEDGKFSSGGGGGGAASGKSPSPELKAKADAARAKAGTISPSAREWASDKIFLGAKDITHEGLAKRINSAKSENHASREDKSIRVERLRALHAKAISLGFRYNTATGNYE